MQLKVMNIFVIICSVLLFLPAAKAFETHFLSLLGNFSNGRNAKLILTSRYEINGFFSYSYINGVHSILLRALPFITTMRWAFTFVFLHTSGISQ